MEISIKDILRILRKNLVFIIIFSLILTIGSFFVSKFLIKKTYTASVKMYVSTDYSGSNSAYDLNMRNYASKMVSTYIQMLDTNKFYTAVSSALNEKYTAGQLKNSITFTSVEDTEVFEVSVVSDSPTEAKRIADAVADTAPGTITELLSTQSGDSAKLKIVDEATVPTAPTSPNVTRNVVIAFIAGIVISFLISIARDYFDIKIKFDEDMTTLCELPVLAAIPDFTYFANNVKSGSANSKK